MKKIFWSLAALMLMSAPMMTSCSSDLDEVSPAEEAKENVVTLTIAFPEQAETRVAIDSDYKLTGWEEGDEVTLVRTSFEYVSNNDNFGMTEPDYTIVGTYTFKCTDATTGTFTGTLPSYTRLIDCQLAFYNATDFAVDAETSYSYFYFSPKKRDSQNMKDVVMMVAKNDGSGNFKMEIFGSILKATNNTGADVTASVKFKTLGFRDYYSNNRISFDPQHDGYIDQSFEVNYTAYNSNHPITLSKDAPTYVYIPVYNATTGDASYAVGLSEEGDAADKCTILSYKTNPGNAKLFNATVARTGTAKATIGSSEVDVKWVQLWKNGPKFAEYNVGVTDGKAESCGGYYCWGSHTDKDRSTRAAYGGDVDLSGEYDTATKLWGSKWRMPTGAEFQALIDNCTVEWTTVNGMNGRKYTGKGIFASNSVFLPAAGTYFDNVNHQGDLVYYWCSTHSDGYFAYRLHLESGIQEVTTGLRDYCYSVRAVLVD